MHLKTISHKKFDKIDSTQEWLKNNFHQYQLVSTKIQTDGIGRQGRVWLKSEHSLAFSFLAKPSKILSKTPLEIAVLCAKFFNNTFSTEIKLKWPNDLLLNKRKCGGIICHNLNTPNENLIVVGIGININETAQFAPNADFPNGRTSIIIPKLEAEFEHIIPKNFYNYFNDHRIDDSEINDQWLKNCGHINSKISTHQNKNTVEGLFVGLGANGQALLQTKTDCIEIYSGELLIEN